MSNENEQTAAATEGKKARAPKVVKHIDEKIADAREDLAAAQKKLDALLLEQGNRGRIDSIEVGSDVSFEYGRGEKKRNLTGKVIAIKDDEKAGKLLAVVVGEGFDAETLKIRAADVQFSDERGDIS